MVKCVCTHVYSPTWVLKCYVCKLLNLPFGDFELHFRLLQQLTGLLFFFKVACLVLFLVFHKYLNFPFLFLCSKSTLTLVTTTWPRQRSRTNSCRRRQRQRRPISQATTSPPRRTFPRGNLLWWPANWQADADTTSAA